MRRIINLDGAFLVNIIIHMKDVRNKHNWIKSICINGVIAVTILLFTQMVYETNDDYSISLRILEGYSDVFFVNYYLVSALSAVQRAFPPINVHVVVMIAASFISFVCILKLVMDKSHSRIIDAVSVSVIALFSFDHYCTIQFTKTAGLVVCTATVVLLDAFFRKRGMLYYALGICLLYYGAALRIDGVIVILAFAGLYCLKNFVGGKEHLRSLINTRRAIVFLVLIAVMAGCYIPELASRRMNSRNEALLNYNEYNYYRSELVDYAKLSDYEEHRDEYKEAGFSKNDIYLIKKWFFDYDGAASKENMKTLLDIVGQKTEKQESLDTAFRDFLRATKRSIESQGLNAIHLTIIALLAVVSLILSNLRGRVYIISVALMNISLHIYLFYINRPVYRAIYVVDVCTVLWFLYALSETGDLKNAKNAIYKSLYVIAIAAPLLLTVPAYQNTADTFQKVEKNIMPKELAEFLMKNQQQAFITATREKRGNPSQLTPWKAPNAELERNYIGTGSWGTLSPYMLNKLANYGMDNPIVDIIDNPKAFFVGNKYTKRIIKYYNKWYADDDRHIEFREYDEVAGIKIWQVISVEN